MLGTRTAQKYSLSVVGALLLIISTLSICLVMKLYDLLGRKGFGDGTDKVRRRIRRCLHSLVRPYAACSALDGHGPGSPLHQSSTWTPIGRFKSEARSRDTQLIGGGGPGRRAEEGAIDCAAMRSRRVRNSRGARRWACGSCRSVAGYIEGVTWRALPGGRYLEGFKARKPPITNVAISSASSSLDSPLNRSSG